MKKIKAKAVKPKTSGKSSLKTPPPPKTEKSSARKASPAILKSKGAKAAGRVPESVQDEIQELKNRLQEAEETLEAIRSGAVDALVVSAPEGEKVYTLKGAEYPYRIFFETMDEGGLVVSGKGIILACNRGFEHMVGVNSAKLSGSSFYDFLPPEEREKAGRFVERACRTGTARGRQQALRKETVLLAFGGRKVPALLAMSALRETEEANVCVVITDLTAQKKAEEILRGSHDELELKVWERTAELRSSKAELQSQNEELRSLQEDLQTQAAELEIGNAELEAQNEELLRAEEALRESEERYRSIFEGASDGIIACDLKTGKFLFANNKMSSLLGYPAEEIPGLGLKDIHPPEDLPYVREEFNKMAAGKITVTRAIPVMKKDGGIIYCDIGSSLLGEMVLIGFFRDITERKLAEEQINVLNEQLKRQIAELDSTNKELDSFSYSISHDLRAPLRHISGFIKILAEDYTDRLDEQGRDYLERVYKSSEKMSKLIEELLYLSHISRRECERRDFNLSTIACAVVAGLRASNPERQVEVSIKEGLVAFADPGLTEIALSNLLGNAWKFTSKTENPRIEFGPLEYEGKTAYYIRDNGAGFDPDNKEKLFLPFQRLHSEKEFEGLGIGLSIAARIIRSHGGRIWAEGEKGKGATFFFTLN